MHYLLTWLKVLNLYKNTQKYRDIFVYFNVNLKLLTKLKNSLFVGEWTT